MFGFALTLLVVSLEVPRTYIELQQSLRGFIPFGICFAVLINIWYSHFQFFRPFGLEDLVIVTLNAILLFFILFYIYPLKLFFTLHVNTLLRPAGPPLLDNAQSTELMVIYGLGFAAMYLLFTGLSINAYHQRHQLGLTPLERVLTRPYIAETSGMAVIGLIFCALALFLPGKVSGLAGFSYFLIPVFKTFHGIWSGRQARRAKKIQKQIVPDAVVTIETPLTKKRRPNADQHKG